MIPRTSTLLLTVNSDYLSDRLLKMAKMDNSYSESSVQQTTEPAMFFPPLPTKPLPTPTEMDNWLSDLDAKNDEQTSSVPSVGSGDIELSGFNPEVVSITDLIVQRKPTRPLRNDVYVKLPRKIARTRISRVVNDQLPAAPVDEAVDVISNLTVFGDIGDMSSSEEDEIPEIPLQLRQKKLTKNQNAVSNGEASQKRKRPMEKAQTVKKPKLMTIRDALPVEKEDEIYIDQQPTAPLELDNFTAAPPRPLLNSRNHSSLFYDIFGTSSSEEDDSLYGDASHKRKRLTKKAEPNKKRKLMKIPNDLPEQQVVDIDEQPIIAPATVIIQGLPVATTKQSLPTSFPLKRKRQQVDKTAPSKKPRTEKNDEVIPATADSIAQVRDPETLFRQAFENVAERSKVEIKNITGLTIYRVNLLADKLCEKVDKTKRNSKYRLI